MVYVFTMPSKTLLLFIWIQTGMEGEQPAENLILIPTITSSFSENTGKPPFPSTLLFFTQAVRNRKEFALKKVLPQISALGNQHTGNSTGEESLGSALPLPSEPHLQLKWPWIRSLKLFRSTINLVKVAILIINNSFCGFHCYTSNHFHTAIFSWERWVSCYTTENSISCLAWKSKLFIGHLAQVIEFKKCFTVL